VDDRIGPYVLVPNNWDVQGLGPIEQHGLKVGSANGERGLTKT
jgi:hypothetical protein